MNSKLQLTWPRSIDLQHSDSNYFHVEFLMTLFRSGQDFSLNTSSINFDLTSPLIEDYILEKTRIDDELVEEMHVYAM